MQSYEFVTDRRLFMAENEVRINKYLSEAGFCSRREADRLVEAGRVTIDGITAVMGSKISDGQNVCVDHKPVTKKSLLFL